MAVGLKDRVPGLFLVPEVFSRVNDQVDKIIAVENQGVEVQVLHKIHGVDDPVVVPGVLTVQLQRPHLKALILSVHFHHPFSPVLATPSTKYFWQRKNRATGGTIARTDIAMVWFQLTVSVTSRAMRRARDRGYFFTLLM